MLSVQKCEHRIRIYHLLQYRTATQDIEKHYNVINQYNIIEQYNIIQYNNIQHNITQHNITQNNT